MVSITTLIPKTYHSWEALDQLSGIVGNFSPQRILIVADPVLNQNGILNKITLSLLDYDVAIFLEVEPEPSLALGEKIVGFTRQSKADLVIGIGGGSALDLAKLAATISSHDGQVADYLNLTGTQQLTQKGLPKILIPTTSGTGSEVTNISVLSLENSKDVIVNDYLLSDIALIDPALTLTVPPRVTAATGIDALTHAIEAYLSVNADPLSDQFALSAIRLISQSLYSAYADGQNIQARMDMSYGSYLAGVAFFNSGAGAVHALAYPLGGQFKISHGESNALLLCFVLSYIRAFCPDRLRDIGKAMGMSFDDIPIEDASIETIDAIQDLVTCVNIPKSLKVYDIPESALVNLSIDAIKQTRLLARSPRKLLKEDIFKIYNAAWRG